MCCIFRATHGSVQSEQSEQYAEINPHHQFNTETPQPEYIEVQHNPYDAAQKPQYMEPKQGDGTEQQEYLDMDPNGQSTVGQNSGLESPLTEEYYSNTFLGPYSNIHMLPRAPSPVN